MALYLLSILLCFIFSFSKNKDLKFYLLCLLLLFLCGGYMTGSDWRNYEQEYNVASFVDLFDIRFEIGYSVLQSVCHSLSIDFWIFHIAIKVLCFYLLCRLIRFFEVNMLLFWGLFLPEMGFYLFIDCPFRNLIAFGISCLAFPYLFKKQPGKYFFIATCAVLFHYSALFLYLLYFIKDFRIGNKIYVVLYIFVNIFAYKVDFILNTIFVEVLGASEFLQDRLLSYALNENFHTSTINVGTLYRTFFWGVFLWLRPQIENSSKYGSLLFNISMFFFLVYPFTISLKIFNRFSIYLLPFYLVTAITCWRTIVSPSLKIVIISVLIAWSFIKTYTVVTDDYRYIPYTNYILYLFQDKPDYRYRSNYNLLHSPYGNN